MGEVFTVYVLYSSKYDRIYIGYTNNLVQRVLSHNKLAVKGWTIRFRPWEVIYTEVFNSKAEALQREKQLKTARGRKFIHEELLNNFKRI